MKRCACLLIMIPYVKDGGEYYGIGTKASIIFTTAPLHKKAYPVITGVAGDRHNCDR